MYDDAEELAAIFTAGGVTEASVQTNSSSVPRANNSVNVNGTSFFNFLEMGIIDKLQSK